MSDEKRSLPPSPGSSGSGPPSSGGAMNPVVRVMGHPLLEPALLLLLLGAVTSGLLGRVVLEPGSGPEPTLRVLFTLGLAGLIGYGTNWIAIQMFFWPRRRGRWWILRWRGLIYDQKEYLAQRIPRAMEERNLISSRAILFHLFGDPGKTERTYDASVRILEKLVDDPEVRSFLARSTERLLREMGPDVVDTLLRGMDDRLHAYLEDRMAADRLVEIARDRMGTLLDDPLARRHVTGVVLGLLRAFAPRIARAVHQNQVQQNSLYRLGSRFGVLSPDRIERDFKELLTRENLERAVSRENVGTLLEVLAEPDTRRHLDELLERIRRRLVEWFRSRGAGAIQEFVEEEIEQQNLVGPILEHLHENREEVIAFLQSTLADPREERAVERVASLIIEEVQLKELIRRQIEQQDPADFKRMIEQATSHHLRFIKLLGGVIGSLGGLYLLQPPYWYGGPAVTALAALAVAAEVVRQRWHRQHHLPVRRFRLAGGMMSALMRAGSPSLSRSERSRIRETLADLFPELEEGRAPFREVVESFSDGLREARLYRRYSDRSGRRELVEALEGLLAEKPSSDAEVALLDDLRSILLERDTGDRTRGDGKLPTDPATPR